MMRNNGFKFVNLNENDAFSKINGSDLQELIWQLNHYLIELRETLDLESFITFGLELEFEAITRREQLEKKFENNEFCDLWNLGYDGSLIDGAEIRSPILIDSPSTWKQLEEICKLANAYGQVGIHSAGHVHIGSQTIGNEKESWMNFIKFWGVYENIIYRFVYGEFYKKLSGISHCRPVGSEFLKDYELLKKDKSNTIIDIINNTSHRRAQAVNFNNVDNTLSGIGTYSNRNTIEFRCPNGTLNPVVWQNNVNLFVRLLLYSRDLSKYDDDIIEKRKKSITDDKDGRFYEILFIEQALELCDILFTKNLDKVNFLRQYFKSFETQNGDISRSRNFTSFKKK